MAHDWEMTAAVLRVTAGHSGCTAQGLADALMTATDSDDVPRTQGAAEDLLGVFTPETVILHTGLTGDEMEVFYRASAELDRVNAYRAYMARWALNSGGPTQWQG